MDDTQKLYQAAEVLEKAAAYIDSLETSIQKEKEMQSHETATKLAERISSVIGEPVTEELAAKLAHTDQGVQALLGKLASEGPLEPLGGPQTIKTATDSSGMGSAERSFLDWLTI